MTELSKQRCFLKRSKLPSTVVPSDFSIGSQVLIYGRELQIIDYADPLTRTKLAPKSEQTSIWIAPERYAVCGTILSDCERNGYMVTKVKVSEKANKIRIQLCPPPPSLLPPLTPTPPPHRQSTTAPA